MEEEDITWLSVKVPVELHRQIKAIVGLRGTTLREFVLMAIRKEMGETRVVEEESP